MALQEFDETLARFGLERVRVGLDLQLDANGDFAITRDGDLQMGPPRTNAMFRFIERWRLSESTISDLFVPMLRATVNANTLAAARNRGELPTLRIDPAAFHETTDAIVEAELISSTLGGSIAVVLNSLLQRFKKDLNASHQDWHVAGSQIAGFSIGEILAAAAANFRHYDEWASSKRPTAQQLESMTVLSKVLDLPVLASHGFPTIRSNVCGQVIAIIGDHNLETLHQRTVGFAKSLASF